MKAPIRVPEPPVSRVPPITAAAMAAKVISDPPARGSIDPMRNASMTPAKPAKNAAQHEIAHLDAGTLIPTSFCGDEIPARCDCVQSETGAV